MKQTLGTAAAYTTGIGDVGTVGYIDPEYIRRHVYHRYCDVYSMGIVMLQCATGRAPLWNDAGTSASVTLSDFCYDSVEQGHTVAIGDPAAGWPSLTLEKLCKLGLQCTETGRNAADNRPDITECISTVGQIIARFGIGTSIGTAAVGEWEPKECMVCLDEPRGENRFLPCRHAVCCNDCAAILLARRELAVCPTCRTRIESVQEGTYRQTFEP